MLGRCQLPICFHSRFHLRPMRCNSEGRSNNRWRNSVKGTMQVSRSLRRSSSLTLSRKLLTGKIQRRIVAELRKWAFIILFCSSFWTSVCHCQQPIIAKINCQCGEVLFFLLLNCWEYHGVENLNCKRWSGRFFAMQTLVLFCVLLPKSFAFSAEIQSAFREFVSTITCKRSSLRNVQVIPTGVVICKTS